MLTFFASIVLMSADVEIVEHLGELDRDFSARHCSPPPARRCATAEHTVGKPIMPARERTSQRATRTLHVATSTQVRALQRSAHVRAIALGRAAQVDFERVLVVGNLESAS